MSELFFIIPDAKRELLSHILIDKLSNNIKASG